MNEFIKNLQLMQGYRNAENELLKKMQEATREGNKEKVNEYAKQCNDASGMAARYSSLAYEELLKVIQEATGMSCLKADHWLEQHVLGMG